MIAQGIAAFGVGAALYWLWARLQPQPMALPAGELAGDGFPVEAEPVQWLTFTAPATIGQASRGVPTGWTWPSTAEPYRPTIAAAAEANGVPADLLARLLYQESRFREDIITGRTRSSAGAVGIAQLMPATARELGVDPLNPSQAINAAARYLRRQFDAFGDWTRALAAYNWGPGNVQRRGLDKAPKETRDYVAQITRDVPL